MSKKPLQIMAKLLANLLTLIIVLTMTACASKASDAVDVVSAPQFRQILDSDPDVYLLDVRTPEEYAEGHIQGAHLLNWLDPEEFKADATHLDKSKTIMTYCRSGRRSLEAATYLTSQGYKVIDLEGGIQAWEKDDFPIVTTD